MKCNRFNKLNKFKKIYNNDDDAVLSDAIAGISTEIRLIREKLCQDSDTLGGNVPEISSKISEGNDLLREILLKMDEIRDEIRESTRPWYSRMACW